MRRKPYAALMALSLFCSFSGVPGAFAQSINLEVVGSAGETRQHPDFGSLHWTVGEPVVETIQQNQARLTQGFHQANYQLIVADESVEKPSWSLRLFPNPTAEEVTLETAYSGELNLLLTDVHGKELYTQQISGVGTHQVDLRAFPAGTYLLRVRDDAATVQTFKILKISL